MRYQDINIGELYLVDRYNEAFKQFERGVNVIKVESKRRNILLQPTITGRIIDRDGNPVSGERGLINIMDIEKLEPVSSNPMDNIIIRYPLNSPTFSSFDVELLGKVLGYAVNKNEEIGLSDQDMICLTALLSKIKFYSSISETHRPIITSEE